MATIVPVRVDRPDGGVIITWTNLVNSTSDVGRAVYIGDLDDVSVQAVGTSATTCIIQGSNDGTSFNILGAGVTVTVGATGNSPVLPLLAKPMFLRPATPSAASDTDIIVVGARRR